jgi:hypothetical protein
MIWPSRYARFIGFIELLRGAEVVMAEYLPTGELVLLTRAVLEEHVQRDRERPIGLREVRQVILEPDAIYDDGRPTASAKGKGFAMKLRPDPHGSVKMKRLIVHLKRCRKLKLFPVSFVSTVLLTSKSKHVAQAKLVWSKPGVIL